MEQWVTWIALVLMAIMVFRFMPKKGVKYISTKELQPLLEREDIVFVDVRSASDYKEAHIPNFINRPVGSYLGDLPKDKPLVVICQRGVRSNNACKELVKLGYTDVTNVRRGMNGLKAA